MKKLTKAHQGEIDTLVTALNAARDTLEGAVSDANSQIEDARNEVEQAQDTYNEAAGELKAYYEQLSTEAQDYYDERSEKWQEGDAGCAYQEWIDQLGGFDIEESSLDLPIEIDFDIDELDTDALPPSEPEG